MSAQTLLTTAITLCLKQALRLEDYDEAEICEHDNLCFCWEQEIECLDANSAQILCSFTTNSALLSANDSAPNIRNSEKMV